MYYYVYHVISLFLPSLGVTRHGVFGLLFIYRIVYFGVIFDLVIQKCKNFRGYVSSKSNRSLIKLIALLFSNTLVVIYIILVRFYGCAMGP